MLKKCFLRGLLGLPLGIAMGHVITILIALTKGGSAYDPCAPALVESMGGALYAIILQTVLCGILGAGFAASSVIWEMEHWSIFKQNAIYFLIASVLMLPIAYFAEWMEHTWKGFLSYYGIVVLIFVITWISQMIVWRNKVKSLNAKLK